MGSDMAVALGRATAGGGVLFGCGGERPPGEPQSWLRVPGRVHAPGQAVRATHLEVPQARQTWAVVGARCGGEWGYRHGLNEKGVAAGVTGIHTRLERDAPGLTGPDLVRLALERAGSACQAVEVLTDLIARHGQCGPGLGEGSDSAFAVADGREAYVLEACGSHWALQAVPAVRAVSDVCHLRRDWDRIARGLADLAIARGWWPADGSKLDFAGALGRVGPDHSAALRRWGQATLRLEQHSGAIDLAFLRRLLAEPAGAPPAPEPDAGGSALIAQLSADPGRLPLAWCAFGPPGFGVYFPLVPAGEVPSAFGDAGGAGSRLWRQLAVWQADTRRDPRLRAELRSALAALQDRLDQDVREFAAEAADLARAGAGEELRRLAASFMEHGVDCFDELAAGLGGGGIPAPARPRARTPGEEFAGLPGSYF
jgi:hypothetical protein